MALCAPEAIVVGSVILVVALMRSCVGAFMRRCGWASMRWGVIASGPGGVVLGGSLVFP